MGNIKEKIEMELKPFEPMCETTTEHLRQLINGGEQADANQILTVAKVLGEIIDVKKDIVEMCYKKQILEAMEESDYGEDYDFRGKKGYSEPYKKGKMMDDDFYKQRDMDMPKRMYYTETSASQSHNGNQMSRDSREGMSGNMRKTYVESKELHGKDSDEMENLEEYLDTLETDIMQLKPNMTAAEKQMTHNKLQSIMSKVM